MAASADRVGRDRVEVVEAVDVAVGIELAAADEVQARDGGARGGDRLEGEPIGGAFASAGARLVDAHLLRSEAELAREDVLRVAGPRDPAVVAGERDRVPAAARHPHGDRHPGSAAAVDVDLVEPVVLARHAGVVGDPGDRAAVEVDRRARVGLDGADRSVAGVDGEPRRAAVVEVAHVDVVAGAGAGGSLQRRDRGEGDVAAVARQRRHADDRRRAGGAVGARRQLERAAAGHPLDVEAGGTARHRSRRRREREADAVAVGADLRPLGPQPDAELGAVGADVDLRERAGLAVEPVDVDAVVVVAGEQAVGGGAEDEPAAVGGERLRRDRGAAGAVERQRPAARGAIEQEGLAAGRDGGCRRRRDEDAAAPSRARRAERSIGGTLLPPVRSDNRCATLNFAREGRTRRDGERPPPKAQRRRRRIGEAPRRCRTEAGAMDLSRFCARRVWRRCSRPPRSASARRPPPPSC